MRPAEISCRKAIVAIAALFAAIRTLAPAGLRAESGTAPEVRRAMLGLIALTDAAPLIVAE